MTVCHHARKNFCARLWLCHSTSARTSPPNCWPASMRPRPSIRRKSKRHGLPKSNGEPAVSWQTNPLALPGRRFDAGPRLNCGDVESNRSLRRRSRRRVPCRSPVARRSTCKTPRSGAVPISGRLPRDAGPHSRARDRTRPQETQSAFEIDVARGFSRAIW